MPEQSIPISSPFPEAPVKAVARGEAVLGLGTGSRRQQLAAVLATASDNPAGLAGRSLPEVARYVEATQSRHDLLRTVRDWVETHEAQPTPLHKAVAGLPLRHLVDLSFMVAVSTAKSSARLAVGLPS